ncbi:PDZ domain-containing protein [Pseudidiomarina gelatinasegens]|uniref:M61 family metallopeptidase n=1 Tax=Pseudidiomarina gelatinasegens TaxID=2487740 RepID=UPI0030EF3C1F
MLHYRIRVKNANAHIFAVAIEIPITKPQDFVKLSLPAWIPGSYMIRDFAKNISDLRAEQQGTALKVNHCDKQTWQIDAPEVGMLLISYEVYAFDLSVRSAYLDQFWGFFNHSSLCMAVAERTHEACRVTVEAHEGWHVATGMQRDQGHRFGPGEFRVDSYESLIDYPVLMGPLDIHEFIAGGVKHALVFAGRHYGDVDRICRDLAAICEYQIELFGHEPPFKDYLFLTMVVGKGFGGLEHRNSTALVCSRKDLVLPGKQGNDSDYRTFLSLCSHEYFHSWNIKTLKPKTFIPYQLDQEHYTEQLWFYEGVTSYYDDYVLHQSGLIDSGAYLTLIGETMARVQRGAGIDRQTVTESSFHAWTKFYKQDENSPNSIVSYYAKGALIALCLDLTLRLESDHRVTLAQVMHDLWHRYGKTLEGTDDDTVQTFIQATYGIDVSGFLQQALYTTQPLPTIELLAKFGVTVKKDQSADDNSFGGKPATARLPVALGAKYKASNNGLELLVVFAGEAAQECGLSATDRIIAIDNLQITDSNIKEIFERYRPGDEVTVHAFRRDELITLQLTWHAPKPTSYLLSVSDPQQVQGWLRLQKNAR